MQRLSTISGAIVDMDMTLDYMKSKQGCLDSKILNSPTPLAVGGIGTQNSDPQRSYGGRRSDTRVNDKLHRAINHRRDVMVDVDWF